MADDIAPGATSPGKEEARSSSSFVHDFESQLKQIHHLDIWGCAKTEEKVVSRSGFYPIKQQPDSSAMTDANMKIQSFKTGVSLEIDSLRLGMSQEILALKLSVDKRLSHLEDRSNKLAESNKMIAQVLSVDVETTESPKVPDITNSSSETAQLSPRLRRTQSVRRTKSESSGVCQDERRPKSELLERIAKEIDYLYKEATTPSYAKVEGKGAEVMCVMSRMGTPQTNFAFAMDWIFGICKPDMQIGKEGSRLIHPLSRFKSVWSLFMILVLIYSALMIPVQLSLWSGDNVCYQYPTIQWDVAVDIIFLVDMVFACSCGVFHEGKYVDNFVSVVYIYFTRPSGFLLDAVTSLPLATVDYFVSKSVICDGNCNTQLLSDCSGQVQSNFGDERAVRLTRILKLVRLFQLLRLLKFLKFSSKIEDFIDINPLLLRIIRVYVSLILSVHMLSCGYFRLKLETSSTEDVETFLLSKGVDPQNHWDVYVMCFYFVFTVFTTVGFGDIYAINWQERVFCVVLFMFAASIFGTVLGEVQEILNTIGQKEKDLSEHMEGVPKDVAKQVKQWVRFQFTYEEAEARKKLVLEDEKLPEALRAQLASRLSDNFFAKVPFIVKLSQQVKSALAGQLMLRMNTVYLMPNMAVAVSSKPADQIFIIVAGCVEMRVPDKSLAGASLRVLREGSVFGDCCVHGDLRWAGAFGINADFVAITNCIVSSISCDAIAEVTSKEAFADVRDLLNDHSELWEHRVTELVKYEGHDIREFEFDENTGPPEPISKKKQKEMKYTVNWISCARELLYSNKKKKIEVDRKTRAKYLKFAAAHDLATESHLVFVNKTSEGTQQEPSKQIVINLDTSLVTADEHVSGIATTTA